MPQIPEFLNQVPVPRAPGPPLADADQFTQASRALTSGAAGFSDVMLDFNARYQEARRQADASNTLAGVSQQLGDLQFNASKIPDREQATQTFHQGAQDLQDKTLAGISDPFIKTMVADRMAQEIVIRGLDTQNQSFQLESSKRVGDLDMNLASYAQSAATAKTPELQALLTDNAVASIRGAVAAHWLAPDQGAVREIQYRSKVQQVQALQYIKDATEGPGADRLSPLAVSNYITDPTHFVGLTPDARQSIADQAIRLGRTIVSMRIADQAHADSVADRDLKKSQQSNDVDFLSRIDGPNPPDAAELAKAGKTGLISLGGYEAARNALAKKDNGTDDLTTVAGLYDRFAKGEDVHTDVLADRNANLISKDTAMTLIKGQAAREKNGDSAAAKGYYASLRAALNAPEGSVFDFNKAGEKDRAALLSQASGEWTNRVTVGGEDPAKVYADMLPRYQRATPDTPAGWPNPRAGAIKSEADLPAVKAKTDALAASGQMSPEQYASEKDLIVRYAKYYQAQAQQQKAAPARSGAAVEQVR